MMQGEELARAAGPDGTELVLSRKDSGLLITSNGQVVLKSAARRSETELVKLCLAPLGDRRDLTVLVAGLGMGHTLRAVLDDPRVMRVDVVEHSAPLIEWNRTYLSVLHKEPPLSDPRVHVHPMDFASFLQAARGGAVPDLQEENGGYFLAVVMDLDEGPGRLSRAANQALYTSEGLSAIEAVMRPGGVLTLWAAQREVDLIQLLRERFQNISEIVVPVDLPDQTLDYIYRCRRKAVPGIGGGTAVVTNGQSKVN